jgi:hypothetical protein
MQAEHWILVGGSVALTGVAMWYQVRYYKLVDDLIDALGSADE